MPRSQSAKSRAPFTSTSKKANATGYQKRKSKSGLTKKNAISDVYEFEDNTNERRAKVRLELERDEEMGFGRMSDQEEGGGDIAHRVKMFGIGGDDEVIGSEDDDEIDSDAAFEESDEDRFAGFSFASSRKKQKKRTNKKFTQPEVDLNEDEDGGMEEEEDNESEMLEEEGDPSEFIDVLDFFEGRGNIDEEEPKVKAPVNGESSHEDSDASEEREDDDDDDEEEKGLQMSASDLEDDSPEALEGLGAFISNLSTESASKKRKAIEDSTTERHPSKRRLLKEKTEAGPESEFRVQSSGPKLRLDDLLAPLANESSNLLFLKETAKVLAPGKVLSAPLPQRTQERLDREAAYELTKEEVDKWNNTMKRIREAEHLSFPLQAQPEPRVSNLQLTANFKPSNKLETSVDKLLRSAQLRDEDIEKMEDQGLKAQNLTLEEVAERRAELRKMRDLMFRAEVKAKRIAKIKSKTYRRIKKKERMKLAAQEQDEEEETEEGLLKKEVERARERATLKHRSTSKWAMDMKRKGELSVDQRRDMEEMLRRGERLKQKIQGVGSDSEDEDDDSGGEEGEEYIKQSAFDELANLDGGEPPDAVGKKSVFGMKFMKDAMARDQQRVDRITDDFVKEMGGEVGSGSEKGEEHSQEGNNVHIHRIGGRVVYQPGAKQLEAIPRTFPSLASDTSSVTLKSTDLRSSPPHSITESLPPQPPSATQEANPWLAHTSDQSGSTKIARKHNEVVVNKESDALSKSKNKLNKKAKKREAEKAKQAEDAIVEVSSDSVLTLTKSAPSPKTAEGSKAKETAVNGEDEGEDSEVEAQEKLLKRNEKQKTKGPKAFEQRDLVALAFASDNVVRDFEEIKRRDIAEDAPKEVDTTLPGWGSWGGTGTKKAPPKPHLIKKIAGVDPKSRADFGKAHVIISEKRDKKASKYLVKDLPYPYTSKAQYERSMDAPIGPEWNTRLGFQKATMPKVLKKPGVIIDPLEKMS